MVMPDGRGAQGSAPDRSARYARGAGARVAGTARARHAGYRLGGVAENTVVGYPDVEYCYLAYLIDFSQGTPDGMRVGRGHRRNILAPEFRLAASGRTAPIGGAKRGGCLFVFAFA